MKNVILLTVDALRKDALNNSYSRRLTPFLKSIDNHIIKFENCYSSGPYTQAAFPGILTSSYYLEYGRQKVLSKKRVLVSEILQNNDIETAGIHSNAYLSDYFGWNRGWDYFYDSMEDEVNEKLPYIEAKMINKKINTWIENRDKPAKPFFLWAHYMDIHEPYIPSKNSLQVMNDSLKYDEDEMLSLFTDVLLKRDVSNKTNVESLQMLYLAQLVELDRAIEELFKNLEENGYLENTVIIFTSDHGDEFNEHGGLSHDGKMFNELLRVPLFVYDKAIMKKEICDTLVTTVDIPPTIIKLFELEAIKKFEGVSLLPTSNYTNKGIYSEAVDKHGSRETGDEEEIYCYVENGYKLIYQESNKVWRLYDLKKDPEEMENIFEKSERSGYMKEKLIPRIKRWKYDRQ